MKKMAFAQIESQPALLPQNHQHFSSIQYHFTHQTQRHIFTVMLRTWVLLPSEHHRIKAQEREGESEKKNAQRVKWNANRKEKQIENNVIQYAEYLRFTRLCEWIFSYFPISHETMTITLAESPICWTLTANFNVQSFISHNSPVLLLFFCVCAFFSFFS